VGRLLILRDLTRRRELETRNRDLERLAHLEVLMAGLAHEIKNPLSGMRGAAQILLDAQSRDARTRECTQIIVEEIDRLNSLLAQLLDLTGSLRMERAAVNIHQLLDRVLKIEGAGRAEAPRFVRSFDPSLPPVWGDAGRLTQVFLNLIRNALEASQPGAPITLTTRAETGYHLGGSNGREQFLSLDIADQGVGIAEGDLPRIFSPFFTTKTGGTGLGLAICQRIVNEHGGVLRVRSIVGRGTTFTVTLPVGKALGKGE
jgi:two-component system nitrogen regulation sensor histidine kinase GlnL